jgi:uncharacterized protein YxjI
MSFLDQNITEYILTWEGLVGDGVFTALIQKNDGEKIGKIETKGLIIKKTYLFDFENSEILSAAKASWVLAGSKYDVKDSKNNLLGIVTQKVLTRKKKFTMKNPKGEDVLFFSGSKNQIQGEHEINSLDKNIAKFSVKQNFEKRSRWTTILHNTGHLKINDLSFDRKILFGMFVSCLSNYYDSTRGE